MAKRKLIRTLEQIARDTKNGGKKSKDNKYDPAKQAEGIETRLEASGVDVEKENDKRNLLEKAFNLPDEQNVLFDIFEVLNRPQQAMFGAIDGAITGDGALEGLKGGITGNKDTQFKDILNEVGVTEETEGRLGLDDVLGFAGDVLLDPMDWAILPAKGLKGAAKAVDAAADAVKAAQYGAEVADNVGKIGKSAKAIQEAEQIVNTGAEVTKVKTALEVAEDGLKAAESNLKVMSKKRRGIKQLAMQGLGSGFKGMFNLADSGLETTLKWFARDDIQNAINSFNNIDEMQATIKSADELSKLLDKGEKLTDEALATISEADGYKKALARKTKELDIGLNTYRGIKESLNQTFNMVKTLPKGLMDRVNNYRAKGQFNVMKLNQDLGETHKAIDELVIKISEKSGKPVDEIHRMLALIDERGNVLFDESGKVTLKGMEQSLSWKNVIEDRTHLEQMGLTKKTAMEFEEFAKNYLPEWYNKATKTTFVTENGGSLWHITKGEDGITDTYRIIHPSLRFDKTGTGPDNIGLTKALGNDPDALVNEGVLDMTANDMANMKRLDEQIDALEKMEKTNPGGKSINPNNKEAFKKDVEMERFFEDAKIKTNKATAEVERIDKIKHKKGKKAAQKKLLEAEQEMAIAGASWEAFRMEHYESNEEMLRTLLVERSGIRSKYPSDEALGSSIKDVKTKMEEKFKAPHYLSDDTVKSLEDLAQLEETQEVMAALQMFRVKTQKALTDIQDSGLRITDGYLPHVLTPEWANDKINSIMNPKTASQMAERKADAKFIGNVNAMKGRTWQSSAYEANRLTKGYADYLIENKLVNKEGIKTLQNSKLMTMFEEDVRASLIDLVKKTSEGTADAQIFNDVVLSSVFNPEGGIDEYSDHVRAVEAGGKIPNGFSPISVDDLERKFEGMSRYMNTDSEQFKKTQTILQNFFEENAGKDIYMNKNLERLIKIASREQEPKHMLEFMDSLNNMFKSNKLLSPGFQLRNIFGNTSNMVLGGVPLHKAVGGMPAANKAIKNGEKMLKRIAQGEVLSAKEMKSLENFMEFSKHGFVEYGNKMHDIPEHLLNRNVERSKFGKKLAANKKAEALQGRIDAGLEVATEAATKQSMEFQDIITSPQYAMDKLKKFNMDLNQQGDLTARMTLWTYAKDNPDWLIQNGYDSPEQAVRMILFEYDDLSVVEQDVIKKIVPFYTFTKKNLAFQIQNLGKNTKKYSQTIKAFDSLWGTLDLDAEERDMYKIENFWIPIPGIKDDGTYYAIKSSLPLGDVGEFLETPLQRAVSATAPVVRAPFEMAMNKQAFSGMSISDYKGQKGFYIPEISKKAEYGLSQIGLDVPAMAAADVGRSIANVAKGESNGILDTLNQAVGRTMVSEGNAEKTRERKAYDKLDNLQNSLRYYRERGIEIDTIAEINNKQRFKGTENIIRQLRAMRR